MNTRGSCRHLVRLGMVALMAAGCAAPPTGPTSFSTHVPPMPTLPPTATSLTPAVGPTSATIIAMPMAVSTVPPTPTAIPTTLIRRLDGQRVLFVLYKGYEPVEHDAPRELLLAIPGTKLVEMEDNREKSRCCGGGGGRMWFEPEEAGGTKMPELRIRQAVESGAEVLATACPYCLIQFEDAVKTAGLEERLRVADVTELAAERLMR